MKKFISLLLVAVMCVSAAGCSTLDKLKKVELPPLPTSKPAPTETPQPTAEPTATPPVVTEAPTAESIAANHIIVGLNRTSQEFYDPQNGTVKILTFSYDTPSVFIEERESATDAVNEYLAKLDETYITGNDYGVGEAVGMNYMLELAQDNYAVHVAMQQDMPLELSADRTVTNARVDDKCINLLYNIYSYTGGAHGSFFTNAYVFDSESGKLLTLDDLSSEPIQLKEYLKDRIGREYEQNEEKYFAMGVTEAYVGGNVLSVLKGLVREGTWYFDRDGMHFYANEYEIAPYSAGKVDFLIPYDDLAELLDKKWLPEKYTHTGKLSIKPLDEEDEGNVEVIDRVAFSEEGRELALMVEGSIYQVKLSHVSYVDSFMDVRQLWGCSCMNDCALQICAEIPDGMPDLMLSYLDEKLELHELLLTQSGEDGSFILMNRSEIHAQG